VFLIVSILLFLDGSGTTGSLSSDLVGSLLSVEQGRDFFEGKRSVLAQSLDDGKVEVDEFKEQPDTVYDVVFPVESVHGDWVDVLVLTVSGML
jgi:hypothetical protein